MSRSRQILCVCYAIIAAAALYGTWSQNLHYFTDLSIANNLAALGEFVSDTKVNAAARSITIDIMLFVLAAIIWMVYEARRVGIRFVWVYIVLAFCTAISVTFPLFLIARETRLSEGEVDLVSGQPALGDYLGLLAASGLILWICWYIARG